MTFANSLRSHLPYDAAGGDAALWNASNSRVGLAIYNALYENAGNRIGVQETDGMRVTYG